MIILFLASALLCGSIYLNSNKIKRVPTWYASQRCVPCRFLLLKLLVFQQGMFRHKVEEKKHTYYTIVGTGKKYCQNVCSFLST